MKSTFRMLMLCVAAILVATPLAAQEVQYPTEIDLPPINRSKCYLG